MPPVPDEALHILEVFKRLGLCEPTGMGGMAPLRYSEIATCAPWATEQERHVVRDMSLDYIAGISRGKDKYGKPFFDG